MAYNLKDAKITHISLVDKGANGVPFAIIKNTGAGTTIQKQIRIAKTDEDKQIVTGVVYQPDMADTHDDQMTAAEIEKAAHLFMQEQHTYNIDKQHDLDADKGYMVESYIAPCEMIIGDQSIAKGSWVASVQVTDTDTWDSIKKGEITGFSMFGVGIREEIESEQEPVAKGLLNRIAKALGIIEKGAVAEKYNRNRKDREFWAAQDALNSVLFRWSSWEGGMEDDPAIIREALQDFVDIAQGVLIQDDIVKAIGKPPEEISKAGKTISTGNMQHIDDALAALTELKNKTVPAEEGEQDKEEDDLKAEDIAKAVAAAMEPITKQVGELAAQVTELKKEEGTVGDQQEAASTQEQNTLTEAIAKAMNPLTEQVQSLADEVQLIKNSRGGSAQGGTGQDDIHKSAGDASFAGVL